MIPNGYLKLDKPLPATMIEKIQHEWDRSFHSGGRIPVLGEGIRFIPFERSVLDPSIVFCGHCGQWAAVQTPCRHCGAPVY